MKSLVAILSLAALTFLAACANNPRGDTSRENSSPSVYETNSGRTHGGQFPSGATGAGN